MRIVFFVFVFFPQNVKCRICKYKLIIQLVVFLGFWIRASLILAKERQEVMACNWVKTPTQSCHLGFKVNWFMWGIVRSTSVLADIWQHNSPHSIDFKTFYIINIQHCVLAHKCGHEKSSLGLFKWKLKLGRKPVLGCGGVWKNCWRTSEVWECVFLSGSCC